MSFENIKGLEITSHPQSKRLISINISQAAIDELIKKFSSIDVQDLELKPFLRFFVADECNKIFENKIKNLFKEILTDRNRGAFVVGPEKFSYLRKAYKRLDLHTDGTYVKEKTDWLLMTKIMEKNVQGGESVLLHLDDWEDCEKFFNHPVGQMDFIWGSPKSKNVDYKVTHPVFFKDNKGKPVISYIDQFPEPQSLEQGLFLNNLSQSLESSKNKIIFKLPPGCSIFSNNYFMLHGRQPFIENKELKRELMRQRGVFYN
ncbi:MAG: carbon starvation induced protein CsiD [Proteobacteria bacterium]|nr:carbon starvation induced protein CsiD [Pseudomonadota bacterium]